MNTKLTYCYCRVSKESQSEQKGGYGMSRQQSMLMEYVEGYEDKQSLGYTLSTEKTIFLRAEGVSAFSGKNIEKGSVLMNFIDDVKAGIIKNAVLLIENIDRFSRMNPNEATELFLSLVNSGCDIHECDLGVIHHKTSDTTLISAGLSRSNKESARKQKLSIKNWDKRFNAFEKNEAALTAKCPAWLIVDEEKKYQIIETEAIVYKAIFDLYNKGYGQAYIRDYLNENNMTVNNRTVGTWMIHKILTDERLTGKVRVRSSIREKYKGLILYPEVINSKVFNTAQLLLKSKKRGQKINKRANNLFAGIAICAMCKESNLVVSFDGKGSYYRCGHAIQRNKRCHARGFKYDILERSVLSFIRNFNGDSIKPDDNEKEIDRLNLELIYHVKHRDEVRADIEASEIPDALDRNVYKKLQSVISKIEEQIERLKSVGNVNNEITDISSGITDELLNPNNVELRNSFNVKLRKVIKSINAFKNESVIHIGIEYFIGNETQWMAIDSRSGDVISDIYLGKEKVEFEFEGIGRIEFYKDRKVYVYNEKEISSEELWKLIDGDDGN